jgi:hypothetical protein
VLLIFNPATETHFGDLMSAKAAELLMQFPPAARKLLKCSAWTCCDTRGLVNELIA